MKPFGILAAERAQDPERAVREALGVLNRYEGVSGARTITLEQASWLGAVVFLGFEQAKKQIQAGNVKTVILDDSMEAKDSAA